MRLEDQVYVEQCGDRGFTIFLWKDQFSNNNSAIIGKWIGQTNYAPATSAVLLQIFNYNSNTWETVDSDNTTGVDTDFILEGGKRLNVSNYYDVGNWVAFRVYQESKW